MVPPRRPCQMVTCIRSGSDADAGPPAAAGSRCQMLLWIPVPHAGSAAGGCSASRMLRGVHDRVQRGLRVDVKPICEQLYMAASGGGHRVIVICSTTVRPAMMR